MIELAGKRVQAAVAEKKNELDGQKFGKEQLLISARYRNRKDLVSALLDNGKAYTVAEVEQMIEKFMKGQVK